MGCSRFWRKKREATAIARAAFLVRVIEWVHVFQLLLRRDPSCGRAEAWLGSTGPAHFFGNVGAFVASLAKPRSRGEAGGIQA